MSLLHFIRTIQYTADQNNTVVGRRRSGTVVLHTRSDLSLNPTFLHIDEFYFQTHIRELEEQKSRAEPVVSLVDNMVKLGSLYRGPGEAPLSHRIRNLPSKNNVEQQQQEGGGSSSDQAKMKLLTEENEHQAQQRKADIQVRVNWFTIRRANGKSCFANQRTGFID